MGITSGRNRTRGFASSWLWDVEVSANLAREFVRDFGMAGQCGCLAVEGVEEKRVPRPFTQQLTAMRCEMADQRLTSSTIATASFKFSRASSRLAPCVLAPGNSST